MAEGASEAEAAAAAQPWLASLFSSAGSSWEAEDGGCTYYGDPECPSLHAWLIQLAASFFRLALALASRLFSPVAAAAAPKFSRLPEQLLHVGLSVGGVALLVLLLSLVFWQHRLRRYNNADSGGAFGLLGPSPLRFPLHAWKAFASASSPKYCCICRELISGFLIYRNKGWECSICRRACHNTCLAQCDFLPCKTPSAPGLMHSPFSRRRRNKAQQRTSQSQTKRRRRDEASPSGAEAFFFKAEDGDGEAQKHQLVEGVVASDAVCCCCGLACGSTFGLEGLRCLWCCRTLHAECLPHLSLRCDRGELRQLVLEPAAVRPLLSAAANPQVLIRLAAALRPEGVGVAGAMRGLKTLATLLQQSVSSQVKRLNASLLESIRQARKGSGSRPPVDAHRRVASSAAEREWLPQQRGRRPREESDETQPFLPSEDEEPRGREDKADASSSSAAMQTPTELRALRRHLEQKGSAARRKRLSSTDSGRRSQSHSEESAPVASSGEDEEGDSGEDEEENSEASSSPSSRSSRSSASAAALVSAEILRAEEEVVQATTAKSASTAASGAADLQKRRLEQTLAQVLSPKSTNGWRLRRRVLKWLPPDATPVVAVVNGMSGGQAGRAVYRELLFRLNPLQVVDIRGEGGLEKALAFFKPLAVAGRLRVLVCGGDGTVGWVLDSIQRTCVFEQRPSTAAAGAAASRFEDLSTEGSAGSRGVGGAGDKAEDLQQSSVSSTQNNAVAKVPVAICPLGTGNDLSNVLGWGMSFDGDVVQHLLKMKHAVPSALDIWTVQVRDSSGRVTESTFSNYLDVGVAARIALKFHRLREANPELFQSRLANKFLYGEVGFRDFLGSRPSDLGAFRLFADDVEVALPTQLAGICIVNIPSFAGGVKLWGDSGMPETRLVSVHSDWRRGGERSVCSASRVFKDVSHSQFKSSPRQRHGSLVKPHLSDPSWVAGKAAQASSLCLTSSSLTSSRFASRRAGDLRGSEASSGEPLLRRESEDIPSSWTASEGPSSERRGASAHSLKASSWQPQKIDDGLIEVVAFKSLIHLGQVQVGLAKALRICQARKLRLCTRTPTPLQIDGEPSMLETACEIIITRRGQASVLRAPECSPRTQTLAKIQQVLQQALDRQVITEAQSLILLNEFQRSIS